jgi:hypothetical protein
MTSCPENNRFRAKLLRSVCDGTNTYQWDGENRLIEINFSGSGNNSQFTYDSCNHISKIIETASGSVTNTRQFIWGERKADNDIKETRAETL